MRQAREKKLRMLQELEQERSHGTDEEDGASNSGAFADGDPDLELEAGDGVSSPTRSTLEVMYSPPKNKDTNANPSASPKATTKSKAKKKGGRAKRGARRAKGQRKRGENAAEWYRDLQAKGGEGMEMELAEMGMEQLQQQLDDIINQFG